MVVFYTERIEDNHLLLEGDELRHCIKANRKKIGDQITVFDESGHVYTAVIEEIGKKELRALITSKKETKKKDAFLSIAIVPTKNADRMEWFVSKAVEIGIQEIILMKTSNAERSRYKYDRLKRIAFSAAKQSLNFKLPSIREFNSLKEVLRHTAAYKHKFVAHCQDPIDHLLTKVVDPDEKAIVMIGPEGDFTTEEVLQMNTNSFEEVNLGPSRLRTETAGVVAITLLNALLLP